MNPLEPYQQHPLALLYFWQQNCAICHALWPKIEHMAQHRFPKMPLIRLKADENRALMGQLRLLSVPGILLLADGKEQYRANGLIHLRQLQDKIAPAYAAYCA